MIHYFSPKILVCSLKALKHKKLKLGYSRHNSVAQSEGMYFLKRAPRAAQNVVRGRSLPTPGLIANKLFLNVKKKQNTFYLALVPQKHCQKNQF